jgi:hypothetical protein
MNKLNQNELASSESLASIGAKKVVQEARMTELPQIENKESKKLLMN